MDGKVFMIILVFNYNSASDKYFLRFIKCEQISLDKSSLISHIGKVQNLTEK